MLHKHCRQFGNRQRNWLLSRRHTVHWPPAPGYPIDPLPDAQPATATRVFGPGEHEPGIMTLQDGDDIYLAPGAIVYGGLRGAVKGARVSGQGTLDGSRLNKSMCILDGASDVLIEGITMRCGVAWQNTLRNCDGITYRNVKVLSFVPYGDGIDRSRPASVLCQRW